MQKQNGKLIHSKSGVFHIWHIVSSVAQGQIVVNFHNLPVAKPRYEIHVIEISVSPEERKMDIFSNFSQELKVFPNLFPCVYKYLIVNLVFPYPVFGVGIFLFDCAFS